MDNQKLKNRSIHRAKIIKGQIEGLIKAIEANVYCPVLLEQSLAIQRSLKSLDAFFLENHLKTCVVRQIRHEGQAGKAVRELIKVYNLSNK